MNEDAEMLRFLAPTGIIHDFLRDQGPVNTDCEG